jgi:hypothetical protein
MTAGNKRIPDEIRKKRCQGRVGVTIPRDSRSSIPEREAVLQVGYYLQRWKIERFHYVLKSGCAIEKPQERSMDKTTTLILM